MFSAVLRQCCLALFLCSLVISGVSAFGPVSPAQAEESHLYKIGRLTAYAGYCGYRSLVTELRQRLDRYDDFKAGLHDNNLYRYDSVTGLPCGRLERALEDWLEKMRARDK